MSKYTHILFDLDHTLWDFERCATETLTNLYREYQLEKLGCPSSEEFCRVFYQVNYHLWDLYNRGEYDSARLRRERFYLIFDELQLNYEDNLPPKIAEEYLATCPTKPYVITDTVLVLNALKDDYQLHIVTNGFSDVQATKLRSAGINRYFATVTSSDEAGYRKPHEGMFHYALNRVSATPDECVMIGDNLETDILGAQNVGIDSIYFNPKQQAHTTTVTYEIASLRELINIL